MLTHMGYLETGVQIVHVENSH